jgi:hypothetical protein
VSSITGARKNSKITNRHCTASHSQQRRDAPQRQVVANTAANRTQGHGRPSARWIAHRQVKRLSRNSSRYANAAARSERGDVYSMPEETRQMMRSTWNKHCTHPAGALPRRSRHRSCTCSSQPCQQRRVRTRMTNAYGCVGSSLRLKDPRNSTRNSTPARCCQPAIRNCCEIGKLRGRTYQPSRRVFRRRLGFV